MRVPDYVQGTRSLCSCEFGAVREQRSSNPIALHSWVNKQCVQFAFSIRSGFHGCKSDNGAVLFCHEHLPPAICCRGNSIASGWASMASRSPALLRDARNCRSSSSLRSEMSAGRMKNEKSIHKRGSLPKQARLTGRDSFQTAAGGNCNNAR